MEITQPQGVKSSSYSPATPTLKPLAQPAIVPQQEEYFSAEDNNQQEEFFSVEDNNQQEEYFSVEEGNQKEEYYTVVKQEKPYYVLMPTFKQEPAGPKQKTVNNFPHPDVTGSAYVKAADGLIKQKYDKVDATAQGLESASPVIDNVIYPAIKLASRAIKGAIDYFNPPQTTMSRDGKKNFSDAVPTLPVLKSGTIEGVFKGLQDNQTKLDLDLRNPESEFNKNIKRKYKDAEFGEDEQKHELVIAKNNLDYEVLKSAGLVPNVEFAKKENPLFDLLKSKSFLEQDSYAKREMVRRFYEDLSTKKINPATLRIPATQEEFNKITKDAYYTPQLSNVLIKEKAKDFVQKYSANTENIGKVLPFAGGALMTEILKTKKDLAIDLFSKIADSDIEAEEGFISGMGRYAGSVWSGAKEGAFVPFVSSIYGAATGYQMSKDISDYRVAKEYATMLKSDPVAAKAFLAKNPGADKLDEDTKALVEAQAIHNQYSARLQGDLYSDAGNATAMMPAFIGEFVAGGAVGKKVGASILSKTVLGLEAAGTAGATATASSPLMTRGLAWTANKLTQIGVSGIGAIPNDYIRRLTDGTEYMYTKEGSDFIVEVEQNTKDKSDEFWKAIAQHTQETMTEHIGGRAEKLNLSKKIIAKLEPLINGNKFLDRIFLSDLAKKFYEQTGKVLDGRTYDLLKGTNAFNGIWWENVEEMVSNRLSPLIEGEEDNMDLVEEFGVTSLSMLPMLAMGFAGQARLSARRRAYVSKYGADALACLDLINNIETISTEEFADSKEEIKAKISEIKEDEPREAALKSFQERETYDSDPFKQTDYTTFKSNEVEDKGSVRLFQKDLMAGRISDEKFNERLEKLEGSLHTENEAVKEIKAIKEKFDSEINTDGTQKFSTFYSQNERTKGEVAHELQEYITSDNNSIISLREVKEKMDALHLNEKEKVVLEEMYIKAKEREAEEKSLIFQSPQEDYDIEIGQQPFTIAGSNLDFQLEPQEDGTFKSNIENFTPQEITQTVVEALAGKSLDTAKDIVEAIFRSDLPEDAKQAAAQVVIHSKQNAASVISASSLSPVLSKLSTEDKFSQEVVEKFLAMVKEKLVLDLKDAKTREERTAINQALNRMQSSLDTKFTYLFEDMFRMVLKAQSAKQKNGLEDEEIDELMTQEELLPQVEDSTSVIDAIKDIFKGRNKNVGEKANSSITKAMSNKSFAALANAIDEHMKSNPLFTKKHRKILLYAISKLPLASLNFTVNVGKGEKNNSNFNPAVNNNGQLERVITIEFNDHKGKPLNPIQLVTEIAEEVLHSVHFDITFNALQETFNGKPLTEKVAQARADMLGVLYTKDAIKTVSEYWESLNNTEESNEVNILFNQLKKEVEDNAISVAGQKMLSLTKEELDKITASATTKEESDALLQAQYEKFRKAAEKGFLPNFNRETFVKSFNRIKLFYGAKNVDGSNKYKLFQAYYYGAQFHEFFARTYGDSLVGEAATAIELEYNTSMKAILSSITRYITKNITIPFINNLQVFDDETKSITNGEIKKRLGSDQYDKLIEAITQREYDDRGFVITFVNGEVGITTPNADLVERPEVPLNSLRDNNYEKVYRHGSEADTYFAQNEEYAKIFGRNTPLRVKYINKEDIFDLNKLLNSFRKRGIISLSKMREIENNNSFAISESAALDKYILLEEEIRNIAVGKIELEEFNDIMDKIRNAKVLKGYDAGFKEISYEIRDKSALLSEEPKPLPPSEFGSMRNHKQRGEIPVNDLFSNLYKQDLPDLNSPALKEEEIEFFKGMTMAQFYMQAINSGQFRNEDGQKQFKEARDLFLRVKYNQLQNEEFIKEWNALASPLNLLNHKTALQTSLLDNEGLKPYLLRASAELDGANSNVNNTILDLQRNYGIKLTSVAIDEIEKGAIVFNGVFERFKPFQNILVSLSKNQISLVKNANLTAKNVHFGGYYNELNVQIFPSIAVGKEDLQFNSLRGITSDVYNIQDGDAEVIVSDKNKWENNYLRYKYENAGDVLRELAKYSNNFIDPSYLYEKINKIEKHLEQEEQGKLHITDSFAGYNTPNNKDAKSRAELKAAYEKIPYWSSAQLHALQLIYNLLDGDLVKAKNEIRYFQAFVNKTDFSETKKNILLANTPFNKRMEDLISRKDILIEGDMLDEGVQMFHEVKEFEKEVDENFKEFNSIRNYIEVVNGFYSPLEKSIIETKFDKLLAKQWLDKFGKGEEAKWIGLTDWLETKEGSVSKEEVLNFIKENRFEVKEVATGSSSKLNEKELISELESKGYSLEADIGGEGYIIMDEDGEMLEYDELPDDVKNLYNLLGEQTNPDEMTGTKFSQYQLEGEKSNYKEVLVTIPTTSTSAQSKYDNYYDKLVEKYGESGRLLRQLSEEEKTTLESLKPKENKLFTSSHFGEPNILVHLRMNTREDSEGNKVLFLEEVQSDWGQKGKKEGFAGTHDKSNLPKGIKLIKGEGVFSNLFGWETDIEPGADQWFETEKDAIDNYWLNNNTAGTDVSNRGKTPSAPFVTETPKWVKLGLKVALKEAVRVGADKIAWTTGEQQNDRYNLSNQIDRIEYTPNSDDTYELNIYDKLDDTKNIYKGDRISLKDIESLVGKDIAQKISNDSGTKKEMFTSAFNRDTDNPIRTISGDGLKVGGKGMKGFYGSPKENKLGIVGEVAKKFFKQEPKTIEIQTFAKSIKIDRSEEYPVLFTIDGIDITDPMYDDSGEVLANPIEYWVERGVEQSVVEDAIKKSAEQKVVSEQHSIDVTQEVVDMVFEGLPLLNSMRNVNSSVKNWINYMHGSNGKLPTPDKIEKIISDIIAIQDVFSSKQEVSMIIREMLEAWKKQYIQENIKKFLSLKKQDIAFLTHIPLRKNLDNYQKDLKRITDLVNDSNYRDLLMSAKILKLRSLSAIRNSFTTNISFYSALSKLTRIRPELLFNDIKELNEFVNLMKMKPNKIVLAEFEQRANDLYKAYLQIRHNSNEEKEEAKANKAVDITEDDAAKKIDEEKLIEEQKNIMMGERIEYLSALLRQKGYTDEFTNYFLSLDTTVMSNAEMATHIKILNEAIANRYLSNKSIKIVLAAIAKDFNAKAEESFDKVFLDILKTKVAQGLFRQELGMISNRGLGFLGKLNLEDVMDMLSQDSIRDNAYKGFFSEALVKPLRKASDKTTKFISQALKQIEAGGVSEVGFHEIGIYALFQQKPEFEITASMLEDEGVLGQSGLDISGIKTGVILTSKTIDPKLIKVYNFLKDKFHESYKIDVAATFLEERKIEKKDGSGEFYTAITDNEIDIALLAQGKNRKDIAKLKEALLKKTGTSSIEELVDLAASGNMKLGVNEQKFYDNMQKTLSDIKNGVYSEGKTLKYISENVTADSGQFREIENYFPLFRYASGQQAQYGEDLEELAGSKESISHFVNVFSAVNINNAFNKSRTNTVSLLNLNAYEVLAKRVDQQIFYLNNEIERKKIQYMLKSRVFNDDTWQKGMSVATGNEIKRAFANYFNRGQHKGKILLRNTPWYREWANFSAGLRATQVGALVKAGAQIASIFNALTVMKGSPKKRLADLGWAVAELSQETLTEEKNKKIMKFLEVHAPEVYYRNVNDMMQDYKDSSSDILSNYIDQRTFLSKLGNLVSSPFKMFTDGASQSIDLQTVPLRAVDRIAAVTAFLAIYKNETGLDEIDYDTIDKEALYKALTKVRRSQGAQDVFSKPLISQGVTFSEHSFIEKERTALGELVLQSFLTFKSFSINDANTLSKIRYDANKLQEQKGDYSGFLEYSQAVAYSAVSNSVFDYLKHLLWLPIPFVISMFSGGDDDETQEHKYKDSWIDRLDIRNIMFQVLMNKISVMPIIPEVAELGVYEAEKHFRANPHTGELYGKDAWKYQNIDGFSMVELLYMFDHTSEELDALQKDYKEDGLRGLISPRTAVFGIQALPFFTRGGGYIPGLADFNTILKEKEKQWKRVMIKERNATELQNQNLK